MGRKHHRDRQDEKFDDANAFRTRDLIALAAAAVAFFFATQSSPDSSLSLVWYIELPISETANPQGVAVAPLVTDLDGDGRGEVLLLTGSPATTLKVFALPNESVEQEALESGIPTALVSVDDVDVLSGLRIVAGRRPVALAAGYLDAHSAGGKQSVVVVREDWTVLLFDHKLKLQWEAAVGTHVDSLLGSDRSLYELCDVGVLVTSLSATDHRSGGSGEEEEDTGGMVVVSGRLRRKGGVLDGGRALDGRLEAYLQHFSFYALEGRSGKVAWSHEGGGGHPEAAAGTAGGGGGGGSVVGTSPTAEGALATATGQAAQLASSLPVGGQYRLDPASIASLELGPLVGGYSAAAAGGGGGGGGWRGIEDWTAFRSSVLKFALPHGWESSADTRLEIAHFERQHAGGRAAAARHAHKRRRSGGGGGDGKAHQAVGGGGGRGSGGAHSGLGGHGTHGHPAVRLPGLNQALSSMAKKAANTLLAAGGGEGRGNRQGAGGRRRGERPNVIVAHSEHGVEAITLHGGKPVFTLALPTGGLYFDVNGDGVVDHLSVVGRRPTKQKQSAKEALKALAASNERKKMEKKKKKKNAKEKDDDDADDDDDDDDGPSGGGDSKGEDSAGFGGSGAAGAGAGTGAAGPLGDHLSGLARHALALGGGQHHWDASGGSGGSGLATSRRRHADLPPCSCLVLSGVPAREQLFNGSLCDGAGSFRDLLTHPSHLAADPDRTRKRDFYGPSKGHRVEVRGALPCVVPRLPAGGGGAHFNSRAARAGKGAGGDGQLFAESAEAHEDVDGSPPQWDCVFAVSNGVVSSYRPDGSLNWQLHDAPTWGEGNSGWAVRLPPPWFSGLEHGWASSSATSSSSSSSSQELLVVGDASIALVDARSGAVLAETVVPQPPRRRPIMGDFDDDGEAEVLLVSDGAVWGYTVRFEPGGGGGFKLFVGLVVGVALVTYFAHLEVTDLTAQHPSTHDKQQRATLSSSFASSGPLSSSGFRPRVIARLPRSTD